ncbi:MAG: hypothetical protein LCH93_16660 [Proteobacteria bacterium]|nr:hypothetical protein [Pseudomonadota bacterium]
MGTSASFQCRTCGHEKSVLVGGGLANHHGFTAWPVSCRDCRAVTTADFKTSPLACLECSGTDVQPFSDPTMFESPGKAIMSWGDLTLTDALYRCPQCQEFQLRVLADWTRSIPVFWD